MPPPAAISPAVMAERRACVIVRPWGLVVLTGVLGRNDVEFRDAAGRWLTTRAGAAWLAEQERSP